MRHPRGLAAILPYRTGGIATAHVPAEKVVASLRRGDIRTATDKARLCGKSRDYGRIRSETDRLFIFYRNCGGLGAGNSRGYIGE